MLYGHIGVGLAAKRLAPKAPLGSLMLATTAIDVLCGAFMITGIESVNADGISSSIPWSHGLFMALIWSLVGFVLAYLLARDWRMGILIGLLVFSHWVLDFISHPMGMGQELPRDIPLVFNDSPKVGLGLYNSVVAAILADFGLLIGGMTLYLTTTTPKDRAGTTAVWLLGLFIILLAFPAAVPGLANLSTLAMVLLLPIGNWVDRHRALTATIEPQPLQPAKSHMA